MFHSFCGAELAGGVECGSLAPLWAIYWKGFCLETREKCHWFTRLRLVYGKIDRWGDADMFLVRVDCEWMGNLI